MAEHLFTNPDPRLRPQAALEGYSFMRAKEAGRIILKPYIFKVTPEAFPELYRRFDDLQMRANVAPQQLVIRLHPDRTSHDRDVISIGISDINRMAFQDIEFALAHELGHAWREKNPSKPTPKHLPSVLSHAQRQEVEADIFGRCLVHNAEQAIATLKKLPPPVDMAHPSTDVRIIAIKRSTAKDCALFK